MAVRLVYICKLQIMKDIHNLRDLSSTCQLAVHVLQVESVYGIRI